MTDTKLTDSITVTAKASYMVNQSDPDDDRFVFGYTITIKNCGDKTARLLTRHWLITDSDGGVQEVHGDGVIGEQPYISPGAVHTYSSGAILKTPVGSMEGSYGMISEEKHAFDAKIPVFGLAVPKMLN
jgi:ApaG protein